MDHKNVVCTDLKWVGKIINSDSYIFIWELVGLLLVKKIWMKQWGEKYRIYVILKLQHIINNSVSEVVVLHHQRVKIINSCTIKVCIGAIHIGNVYWSNSILVHELSSNI